MFYSYFSRKKPFALSIIVSVFTLAFGMTVLTYDFTNTKSRSYNSARQSSDNNKLQDGFVKNAIDTHLIRRDFNRSYAFKV